MKSIVNLSREKSVRIFTYSAMPCRALLQTVMLSVVPQHSKP